MKEKVEDSTIQHLNWSKWILSLAVGAGCSESRDAVIRDLH